MRNRVRDSAWGFHLGSRDVFKTRKEPVIKHSSRTHQISRVKPVYLALEMEDRERKIGYAMQLRDLVSGKELGRFPLPEDMLYRRGYTHHQTSVSLSGEKLVAVVEDRLIFYTAPNNLEDREPLRLLYPKVDVYSVNETATVPITARGGTGPYQYRLSAEVEGIKLNPLSGNLSVDLPMLWKKYTGSVAAGEDREAVGANSNPSLEANFTQSTGIEVAEGDVPVSVECVVEVTDQSGQKARVLIVLFGTAPEQELSPALENAKDLFEQKRLERMKEQQRRRAPQPAI